MLEKQLEFIKQKYEEGKLDVMKLVDLNNKMLDIAVVAIRIPNRDDDGDLFYDYEFVDYIYGGEYYKDEWEVIKDIVQNNSNLYERLVDLGL